MSGRAWRGVIILAVTATLVTGCGKKQTAASNVVEMRDLDVVYGTANDDMTDLDAVRTNGVGAGNGVGNAAAAPAAPKAAAPGKAPADTEAVPIE